MTHFINNLTIFVLLTFMSTVAGQELKLKFAPPLNTVFSQYDSSSRVFYWHTGEEDYKTNGLAETSYYYERDTSGYKMFAFPPIDSSRRDVDFNKVRAITTTTYELDRSGGFLGVRLPRIIDDRLSYFQEQPATIQRKLLSYRFFTDWFFRTGQLLSHSFALDKQTSDAIRIPMALGDSVSYRRLLTLAQVPGSLDLLKCTFAYVADTSEYTSAFGRQEATLSQTGIIQTEDHPDLLSRGHKITGEIAFDRFTLIVHSMVFVEEQIEYKNDFTSTKWVTTLKSTLVK